MNQDDEVRVIILKGAGDVCFSAGGSIPEFMATHQEKAFPFSRKRGCS
ncbi:hypothetical protein RCO48_31170 [Peribacillus frigoritolerans]|nr:hypothetical protein [Peribacillus frigoritolerans]